MKVITVADLKGGVAKTTTTSVFAACLAQRGYKVLCIDIDPQGNLSMIMAADEKPGLRQAMEYCMRKKSDEDKYRIIHELIIEGKHYDLIPAGENLAYLESDLTHSTAGSYVLQQIIEKGKFAETYDFVIIDTSPTFSFFIVNALVASDYVLVPMKADSFSEKGIQQLEDNVELVKKYNNPKIQVCGILRIIWNPREHLSKQVDEDLKEAAEVFDTIIFDTYIRKAVAVSEAHYVSENLLDYNAKSTVARDYQAFTDEFLKKVLKHE